MQDSLQLRSFDVGRHPLHGDALIGTADRSTGLLALAVMARSQAMLPWQRVARLRHKAGPSALVGCFASQGRLPLFAARRGAAPALCVELSARSLLHLDRKSTRLNSSHR